MKKGQRLLQVKKSKRSSEHYINFLKLKSNPCKMTSNNFEDPINTLLYLRNDDYGWGEFKTQATRLTNTCEAVWAFTELNFSIDAKTIDFLLKSIKNEHTNRSDIQNCSIPRDFGWMLIALTNCNISVEAKELDICLKKIIDDFNKNNIGGFGTRAKPNEYSTFHTAIVLIGLIKLYDIRKHIFYENKETHLELINTIIEEAENAICNKAWGSTKNENPQPSYTAYMLYAFCLYHNKISKKTNIIKNAIKYLENENLDETSFDKDSRPDHRPYRHFSVAWALIAISEFKDVKTQNIAYILAKKLLSLKTQPFVIDTEGKINISGWGLFHSDNELPTTWATALATIALNMFCKRVNCFDMVNMIDTISNNININTGKVNKSDTKIDYNNKNVFLIHGHDISALRDLEKILKESFGLNPIILMDESNDGSTTVIEKFEKYANLCSIAVAIFTPDDETENNGKKYFQARPNVIWEFGWFSGNLGRNRVILILKSGTSIFSDIGGVIRLEYTNQVKEIHLDLSKEFNKLFQS